MPIPDHVLRFWRALDDLFDDVRPTDWGAVVTDARFPAVWDANYARVDVPRVELTAADVEADLLPALERSGAGIVHVVSFHAEETRGLLAELSRRGHRLGWDLVMDHAGGAAGVTDAEVEELPMDDRLWSRVADAMALFGVEGADAIGQLLRLEREVLADGGKRWFGIRDDDGDIVSLAALLVLEGVGYVDNVATYPAARGRGHASAVTARVVAEARNAGARHVCLFADPDETPIVRMYERLGFRGVGSIASTKGPVPRSADQPTNL